MNRLTAFLPCMVLAACATASAQKTQSVTAGSQVTLSPGATVSVTGASLMVRFVSVTEDSRCPVDTACIWAGEVRVLLAITDRGKASQSEVTQGGSVVASEYRVTLVRVEPLPTSTARTAPADYRATLKIDAIAGSGAQHQL